MQWCSWLGHFAMSLIITDYTPDRVTEFHIDLILLDNIMALGSTLPLTEMSTRDVPMGVKAASA